MIAPEIPNELGVEDIERLYRSMVLIRRTEERIAEIYASDKIKSPVHLSIGQEAVSVGVCDVLRADDIASGTYRGHALYLAKGADLKAMMAELFGKSGGCAAGKGGSMHLINTTAKVLGCSAVVATNIPIAVGFALKLKRSGGDSIVSCFFGDGATEEGAFYESLNFASLHKLPILFICENNFLAIYTPLEKRWASSEIGQRVEGFGIAAHKTESLDIFRVRELAAASVGRIRAGGGPEFIECHTYRWRDHVGPDEDRDAEYRSSFDNHMLNEDDQIDNLAAMLPAAVRQTVDASVVAEIDAAIDYAEQDPFPDVKELHTDVFAE
jgi:TPP-dependent pyruvate/acetoin dehydrogenase alpha subunit